MALNFTKMHALGNDFMVIDGVNQHVNLSAKEIQALSSRHTGVGFDQCLVVEKSTLPDVDFFYRIYNADGQSVGQCGNGARAIARFIAHYQLSKANPICVAIENRRLTLQINPDHTVTVNMGTPTLVPSDIPLSVNTQADTYSLPLPSGETCQIHALSIGNPHAVLFVNNCASAPVAALGQLICEHPLFPHQTNVGFAEIIAVDHILLRVYERGCGETQACGSGAVAAVTAGGLFHHLADTVCVSLPGGDLLVSRPNQQGPVFLTGPVSFVYEGVLMS